MMPSSACFHLCWLCVPATGAVTFSQYSIHKCVCSMNQSGTLAAFSFGPAKASTQPPNTGPVSTIGEGLSLVECIFSETKYYSANAASGINRGRTIVSDQRWPRASSAFLLLLLLHPVVVFFFLRKLSEKNLRHVSVVEKSIDTTHKPHINRISQWEHKSRLATTMDHPKITKQQRGSD